MVQYRRLWLLACLLGFLLLAACAPPRWPFRRATPTPAVVPEPPPDPAVYAVRAHLSEATTTAVQAELPVGKTARIEVSFEPVRYQVTRREDGSIQSASSGIWQPHNVAEMRLCTSLDGPCQLTGDWQPFRPEQTFDLPVDWLGARQFWLTTQFRDAEGNTVPTIAGAYANPEPVAASSYTIAGTVSDQAPVEALPPPVQTAVVATRTAFPVRGAVEIEGGRCCAGGQAGDTIEVSAAFEAASPAAPVQEMRVTTTGGCSDQDRMDQASWQPFVPEKSFPVHVALNWAGFYVSVQYRDAQGNLSPVYCDDISVEGHSPAPTP